MSSGRTSVPDQDIDAVADNIDACDNTYDAGDITDEPKNCFRLLGPGPAEDAPNYLAGYSLELQPQGGDVGWGQGGLGRRSVRGTDLQLDVD